MPVYLACFTFERHEQYTDGARTCAAAAEAATLIVDVAKLSAAAASAEMRSEHLHLFISMNMAAVAAGLKSYTAVTAAVA